MSGDSSEEKTEKASQRKLAKARERGEVAKSQELASSVSLLVGLVTLLACMPWAARRIAALDRAVERFVPRPELHQVLALVLESLDLMLVLSLPVVAAAAVSGTALLWLQVGPVFAPEAIAPKLERLDPVAGAKRLFSMKSIVAFAMMLLKTLIVGAAVVLIMRHLLPDAIHVVQADMSAALAVARAAMVQLLLAGGAAFVLLGAVDFGYQKWQFARDQRMSHTEVKREHKEDEGDPHVKGERKRMASEPSTEELLQYMPYASVALTDGDGRLIAIVDRPNIGPKPLFILRATGAVATQAVGLARGRNLAPQRDDRLLENLFPIAHTGNEVPDDHIADVRALIAASRR